MIVCGPSLRGRLFGVFALITLIAAALPALLSRNVIYEERLALVEEQAMSLAFFVGSLLTTARGEEEENEIFKNLEELSFRFTLIGAHGGVMRDSRVPPEKLPDMDNHEDRPEVTAARLRGRGVAVRRSGSLGFESVYAAAALRDGRVLRVAAPLAEVRHGLEKEFSSITLGIVAVAAFCLLLAVFISGRIRRGMEEMAGVVGAVSCTRARARLRTVPGREFLPLAQAVNLMADSIEEYVHTVGEQSSQLETILNSIREGVLVLDRAGRILRRNKTLDEMFPLAAGAEGKPLIEGLPVPALQRAVDDFFRLSPDEAAPGLGAHFEWPTGRFLVAHLSRPHGSAPIAPGQLLPPGSREDFGAVLVLYDATEIMRLEQARRDFVANVSHELRTPLTVVAGYAETLMGSDDLAEEYKNFAGIIHKHAAALAGVVENMLELARIENTRENVELAPLRVEEALRGAMAACREQREAGNISFLTELESASVLGSLPLLTQVFRNLLENACRYSPAGGQVRICSKPQGREVLFIVSDNGPGIARDELPRVFERFYQIKKERNSGSAGIGLAICKHIIERHGGRIWAESPYGDASTAMLFTLRADAGADDNLNKLGNCSTDG
ncbi:MAG: PAS domain-containing sensor histidine kinase [Deltaproteobacteria bacterium]|jgi:two-component system phosphate regulon sensor histidine kinase PhoR|nr:PAS domain-containing sensor histidine kinase [Deltaproteobacteria bacterium]